ncbi:transforming growth factor-beta-induced protein ig-h3-like isoform X1 [Pecten maximus]|uniref:transforming growth factor-beta-induced protein ig-h3-like isoform X1 n=1 Tax=Pecten maximus TaxID=6579 RepID=UPI0014582C03|nr:transforming growth factor-beta-induced protein ig-h3-like isoform X1 [Pecten maximus]
MLPFLTFLLVLGQTIQGEQWDIYDLADSLGCKDFVSALQNTGPMYVLSNNDSGPFTVFAPTDDAFNNLPANIAAIFNFGNWEYMHEIITFHITYGNMTLADFHNEAKLPTWQGQDLRVNIYSNTSGGAPIVTAEGARIVKSAVATNGIVHVVDHVLYNYPQVSADQYVHEQRNMTTLDLVVQITDLQDKLRGDNITLFAPQDSVFENIEGFMNKTLSNNTRITNLVKNHMVNSTLYSTSLTDGSVLTNTLGQHIVVKKNGTTITLNGVSVLRSDVSVTNGVVYTIGGLLFPA